MGGIEQQSAFRKEQSGLAWRQLEGRLENHSPRGDGERHRLIIGHTFPPHGDGTDCLGSAIGDRDSARQPTVEERGPVRGRTIDSLRARIR